MTTDHANDHTTNGFFDQADQDCIWGHEDDLIAEAELELAGEPKHDHAPGHGDIFTCPACIANTTY